MFVQAIVDTTTSLDTGPPPVPPHSPTKDTVKVSNISQTRKLYTTNVTNDEFPMFHIVAMMPVCCLLYNYKYMCTKVQSQMHLARFVSHLLCLSQKLLYVEVGPHIHSSTSPLQLNTERVQYASLSHDIIVPPLHADVKHRAGM